VVRSDVHCTTASRKNSAARVSLSKRQQQKVAVSKSLVPLTHRPVRPAGQNRATEVNRALPLRVDDGIAYVDPILVAVVPALF
jgi:hypothetical protein